MLIGYKIIICYAFYYSLPTPYFFSHAETAEPVMKTADHISEKIWLTGFEFLTAEIKDSHRLVIPGKIILSFKEVILPYNNEKFQSWWVAFSFFRSLRFHFLVNYKRKFKSGYDQHRNLAEKKKNVEEGFWNKRKQFRSHVEVYISNFVVIKCNSYFRCTPARGISASL